MATPVGLRHDVYRFRLDQSDPGRNGKKSGYFKDIKGERLIESE